MTRISASKLPMLAACPGAAALPWTDTSSAWSRDGVRLHRFVARALSSTFDEALADVPEDMRARCEGIDLQAIAALVGGEPDAEVAFAWDPEADSALELGAELDRDYSAAPSGWLVGTADLAAVVGGVAVVADIKSGPQMVEHPRTHLQLRYQALAAARAYGCTSARAIVIRIDDEGEQRLLSADFDEMDLDAIAAELRDLLERVELARTGGDVEAHLHPGECCHYCPAFARCPAQARTALALVDHEATELAPGLVAEAWQRLVAVESAAKRVREAIRGFVLRHPVDLPDGRQLRIERGEQDEVIAGKALPWLAETHGVEAAWAAASTSKAAIEKAVGKEAARTAIAALREAGAIRKKPVDRLVASHVSPDGAPVDGEVAPPPAPRAPVARSIPAPTSAQDQAPSLF